MNSAVLKQSWQQFPEIIDLISVGAKAAQIFVFMPRKRDDDDIYERDQQEPHRMREVEAVQLTNDEEAKDEDGRGVIPKFLTQESDD